MAENNQNQIDLREIFITLDTWSRTCDTILSTLDEQITKIVKNHGGKATPPTLHYGIESRKGFD